MGHSHIEISDEHINLLGIFISAHSFIFVTHLKRHFPLAEVRAQIAAGIVDPDTDILLDHFIVFGRISHTAGAEQSDIFSGETLDKIAHF